MAYTYTVPSAIADAAAGHGISASMIATIMAELPKSQTHADAHMKSEDFWTVQRTGKTGSIGSTATVDEHLKAAYKKRSAHSMFDSPVSAVEAATAALNCGLGVLALKALLDRTDGKGIDLYSRTAVLTMGGTKQFVRSSPDKGATATMTKVDAEMVCVCLRVHGSNFAIASAYPIESTSESKAECSGNDYFVVQGEPTVIRAMPKRQAAVVNW